MEQLDTCGHFRIWCSHPCAREVNSPLAEHRTNCMPAWPWVCYSPVAVTAIMEGIVHIAHLIAPVGLNEVLCATAIGIPSYFRAWLLVHRIHVQECMSVHDFVGLLPTILHFPKGASHGALRASKQILATGALS